METILYNRFMLNLRHLARPESPSELESKVDLFFRRAYQKPHNPEEPLSIMDTILGNIGEPLRVDDESDQVMAERDVDVEEATSLEADPPRRRHLLDNADA